MSDIGGYIWFIGLGAGIVILGLAIAYASARRRKPGVAHPNAAWEQAAAESGHDSVARQPPQP
jgi:hypothetical protein